MKPLTKLITALTLASVFSMCALPFARAAQESITLVPISGAICPTPPPDNGLTTITTNTDGSCTIAAASGVTNPATGNTVSTPYFTGPAQAMIAGLIAHGWKVGPGLTSGISGGIPYFKSATAQASSAALTANALVKGGGPGAAPAASALSEAADHLVAGLGGAAAPTLGACTGGSLDTSSTNTDFHGRVTGTTGATCVILFATAMAHIPHCWANDESTTVAALAATPGGTGSKAQVTIKGYASGDSFDYFCLDN